MGRVGRSTGERKEIRGDAGKGSGDPWNSRERIRRSAGERGKGRDSWEISADRRESKGKVRNAGKGSGERGKGREIYGRVKGDPRGSREGSGDSENSWEKIGRSAG